MAANVIGHYKFPDDAINELRNAGIYFLLLLTQVDFFGPTFYFLESRKFFEQLLLSTK